MADPMVTEVERLACGVCDNCVGCLIGETPLTPLSAVSGAGTLAYLL